MPAELFVTLEGRRWDAWEEVSLTRSIDSAVGTCSLSGAQVAGIESRPGSMFSPMAAPGTMPNASGR